MLRLAPLLIVLGACASDGNSHDQDAEIAFFTTYAQMGILQSQAISAQQQSLLENLDFEVACTAGGTSAIHGTYDGDGTTNATYTLDTTFAACSDGNTTLDGALHWVATQSDLKFTQTISGTVAFESQSYAGTFTFDIAVSIDASDPDMPSIAVSGTYSIGGKTYEIDKTIWASSFGV